MPGDFQQFLDDYVAKASNGLDWGFSSYLNWLTTGEEASFDVATTFWQRFVGPLRDVISDLTAAYTALSEYWTGDAADAFYRDVARVQNYAVEILQMIAKDPLTPPPLIGPKLTGGAGSAAVPEVNPVDHPDSGTSAMLGGTSGGPQQVAATMIDVLEDAKAVVKAAHDASERILSSNVLSAAWTLFSGMEGQAYKEGLGVLAEFNAALAEAGPIGGPFAIGMMAGSVFGEAMAARWGETNMDDWILKAETFWAPVFSQVLYDYLAQRARDDDGPGRACQMVSNAWSNEARALPVRPDPTQLPQLPTTTNHSGTTGPGSGGIPNPYKGGLPPNLSSKLPPRLGTHPPTGPGIGPGYHGPGLGDGGGTGPGTSGLTDPYAGGRGSGHGSGLGGGLGGTRLAGLGDGLGTGAGDTGLGTGAGGGAGAGGAGAGAGGGAAGSGQGGGAMVGGMAGGRGGGKEDEENRSRSVYLPEDDDVWTGGAPGDGPAAGGDF